MNLNTIKSALILLLVLSSFYSDAQGDLLGKSRTKIRSNFKKDNILPKSENSLYGMSFSDAFYDRNGEKITCGYDESKICVEVIKSMQLSLIDSIRNNLNHNYVQRSGETFQTDVWADKARIFKVHLEIINITHMLYLDYLPIDKPYIIH